MVEPWYMEQPFRRLRNRLSKQDYLKLRRFYMQQLALCQALLEAKPLGICKTTTSGENPLNESFHMEGDVLTCISPKEDSREIF